MSLSAKVLMYGSIVSPLAGIVLGIIWNARLARGVRIILIFMTLSFLNDAIMLVWALLYHNNLQIANVYGLFEGLLLFLFFKVELPRFSKLLWILASFYISFYLIDSSFFTNIKNFNDHLRSIEALFMILLCVIYFYTLYIEETDIFIDKHPIFWLVVGILFYFSGAFFLFLLSNKILSEKTNDSWIINNCSNIIKNALFTFAIWRARLN